MEPLSANQPPVTAQDVGLYVHFPYCAKKCPYCDFNSHVVAHDDVAYADAILRELDLRGAIRGPLTSIFFGGGTPSLWDPVQVGRVIQGARGRFGIRSGAEITLEANPGTVAEDRFAAYVAQGINRFSLGVQSFKLAELEALGRIHGAEASVRAVKAAKATGARVSLDLMYALPGQTWDDVLYSIERALALGTDHLSAYTLTVEPDTSLGRRAKAGLFVPMHDDHQATLIEQVTSTLEAAGYRRYEVSNYARTGFEAVHNTLYWVGGTYLGVGAGAHSYLPDPALCFALRRENLKAPHDYLENALQGRFPARFEEHLDRRGLVADRLMVALRTIWGLDLEELEGALKTPLLPIREALAAMLRAGWLTQEGTRYRPTPEGFLFNDTLARTMLRAAQGLDRILDESAQSSQRWI